MISVTELYKITFETYGSFVSYITLRTFTVIISVVLRKIFCMSMSQVNGEHTGWYFLETILSFLIYCKELLSGF